MNACTTDNCDKPISIKSKQLCKTCYNRTLPNRHRKITTTCDNCGKTCEKRPEQRERFGRVYCTQTCRAASIWKETRAAKGQVALYTPPSRWMKIISALPPIVGSARTWVAGECAWCAAAFVSKTRGQRFCAAACARRWHRQRRKIDKRYMVDPAVRAFVYARDEGVCQLCSELIDMTVGPGHPFGPTLDHIICVSWVDEPDHSAENLRLACRMCNSTRGNEGRTSAPAMRDATRASQARPSH